MFCVLIIVLWFFFSLFVWVRLFCCLVVVCLIWGCLLASDVATKGGWLFGLLFWEWTFVVGYRGWLGWGLHYLLLCLFACWNLFCFVCDCVMFTDVWFDFSVDLVFCCLFGCWWSLLVVSCPFCFGWSLVVLFVFVIFYICDCLFVDLDWLAVLVVIIGWLC